MFLFKTLGHFFASLAHDVRVGITWLSNHQKQIDTVVETAGTIVSAIDPALAPIATEIERAGEAVLGEVFAVVSKIDAAAADKGISIELDSAAVAEFKTLLAKIEALKPGSTQPPANLLAAPAATK